MISTRAGLAIHAATHRLCIGLYREWYRIVSCMYRERLRVVSRCIGTGIRSVSTRIDTIPIRTDTGRILRSGCSEPRKVKRYILVRFGVFFSTPYPFRIKMYRDVSCSYRLNNFDFLPWPRIGPVSAHDCGSRIDETRIRRIIMYQIVS